ncbi:relaxase/mobilization nuclease domain-containing protein, partial [Fusobacterium perfoetens]
KHIHNHIVVNSVNFENGEKFYYEEKEFNRWRDRADELAQEYGLEIVQPKEKNLEIGEVTTKSRHTREAIEKALRGEKQSDIVTVSLAVIQAGEEAKNKEDFTRILKEKGVDIDWGETVKEDGSIKYRKYITLTVDEEHRVSKKPKFRLDSLENHIHHPAFNTEKLREHFKELDKKKELERYKPKEQENLWKKHLKNQSRDKDGMEL